MNSPSTMIQSLHHKLSLVFLCVMVESEEEISRKRTREDCQANSNGEKGAEEKEKKITQKPSNHINFNFRNSRHSDKKMKQHGNVQLCFLISQFEWKWIKFPVRCGWEEKRFSLVFKRNPTSDHFGG
ncbi:CLUMA_CG002953, isoform A [Clunio marinus]|uniref:CLUMA_CG002953, isoform A n=1 Tax=Clunio marinus TaxID=568069 RepID=A0A1J1HSM2_9DIPT|nr:CLUMA_CG002953, isoform A [Clunio marinus]